MIVSDDTVSKALAYLAEDPHPLALAQTGLMQAEKAAAERYAQVYLDSDGTVDERKSKALLHPTYKNAKDEEISAQSDVNRHKQRTKAAENIIEIWRTQNANARAAERVR